MPNIYVHGRYDEKVISGKNKFLRDVIDKKYIPGCRLPTIAEFAQKYTNNSIAVSRAVLTVLIDDGIVVNAPNNARKCGKYLSPECSCAIDIIKNDMKLQLMEFLEQCNNYSIDYNEIIDILANVYSHMQ